MKPTQIKKERISQTCALMGGRSGANALTNEEHGVENSEAIANRGQFDSGTG
jgi:hypothetical protein